MKALKLTLLLIILCLLLSACKEETAVTGEITIVIENGDVYHPEQVEVSAISEETFRKFVDFQSQYVNRQTAGAQAIYTKLQNELDDERTKLIFLEADSHAEHSKFTASSSEFTECHTKIKDIESKLPPAKAKLQSEMYGRGYFSHLPQIAASAQTGGGGRFELKLPEQGRFALLAYSKRQVGDRAEEYYWMNWIEVNDKVKSFVLNNQNATSANPVDGIIRTSPLK